MKNAKIPDLESTIESAWDTAQDWMKEHKIITALAAAAILYMVGGKRIRQLASLAVKSGLTAGVANAAMGILPASDKQDSRENVSYH